ncbi:MAG: restriction endonuclease subunit S [Blautia sp.]|nr:restriction endonuclease subunit S [Blautia sp.]MCM1201319.1 restriction endonuclease subunit S [Bacteroides fragilis]
MFLGDLIINHDSKRIPLSARQRENIEKKYPYYGAQGIIDYVDDYLFEGKYLLIAEDGENLRSRKQPIATIAEGKFWVNNHAHIVTSNELSNLEFLCFWLNSNDISEYITGSAQPKLNQSNMNRIPLPDFSREDQDRIAEKLCVYEKKITNNLMNIDLLENIANEIYKEMFLQKSESADGQYAESTVFDNIMEVKKKNADEKDYPVLSVVKEGEFKASEDVFTKQVYSKSTKNYKIVRRNQVAYNPARANIGSIAMLKNYDIGLISPIYIVFEMKDTITPTFFYYYMKQPIFLEMIRHHAIGTTRQNFPFEAFKMFPVAVPTMELQLKFEEIAKPVERKITKLKEENKILAEIRDTLLSRLMSGELPVEAGEN